MRKEEFFEVLGELDDGIVKGAGMPVKRRVNWKVWAAAAACLALLCAAAVRFIPWQTDNGEPRQPVADVAPMVYVNDTLYIQSSDQQGYPELRDDFIYLGEIESTVSEDGAPKENFQANHLIAGCAVYQFGENIVVHINQAYWLYVRYGEPEVTWSGLVGQEEGTP